MKTLITLILTLIHLWGLYPATATIYLFQTEIGNLYIVQYTLGGSHLGEIVDLYLGWSKEEATKKFERICSQIINGRK